MANNLNDDSQKKILVIIPAYNEEKTIKELIERIPAKIDNYITQILVINDGSSDKTVNEAGKAGAMIYSHQKNMGLGKTFSTGISQALKLRPAIVVNIDADGQFDPAEIIKLVKPIINNEADFVTGSRFMDKKVIPKMPRIKIFGNKIVANIVNLLTGNKFYDVSCGFRAYSYDAVLKLNLFGKFTYTQETFMDFCFKDLRIKEIPVNVKYFPDRKSKVANNLWKYGLNIIVIILRAFYDYNPLKFFCLIGSFLLIVGLGLGAGVLIHFFQYKTSAPYRALGIIGLFACGMGLLTFLIGLVIDILGRIRKNQEQILYYSKKKEYENID